MFPAYLALPQRVMQSDLLRVLVLHHWGGVFLDMDTE
jgi:mannosyltransferase OCH1-like enzyme